MTDQDPLAQRVEQLESVVRALYPLVQQLRAEVAALRAGRPGVGAGVDAGGGTVSTTGKPVTVPPTPAVPIASPRPGPRPDDMSMEAAVGRYGALALATVSILLGVGAFVQWAIARGLLGPTVRVGLGLVAAAAIATFGFRLRTHGARRFGHTMLALALAIVHVDAWGAGPKLHLVSSPVALAVAAIASALLGWLALLDGEPTVFSVGVGGALLAPFVTSSGEPHIVALLAFGFIVIALSVWSVRDRDWAVPVAILAAGSVLYTAVGAEIAQPDWSAPAAFLPAAFALACAGTALVVLPSGYRSTLAQGALVALCEALARLTAHGSTLEGIVGAAAIGTFVAYATVPRLGDAMVRTWLGACVLPLWLLADAVWAMPPVPVDRSLVTVAWAGGAAAAAATYGARSSHASDAIEAALRVGRSLGIAMAGLLGGAAIVIGVGARHPVDAVMALSAYTAALAVVAAEREWPSALAPIAVCLAATAVWAWALLAARVNYAYTPFLTHASAAAAASVTAWIVAAMVLARASWTQTSPQSSSAAILMRDLVRLLEAIAVAVLFFWVRQELSGAVSSEVSTFLLIVYYAAFGVGAVFVGRARLNPPLRHAGLAVATYAAIKAVVQASHLAVALRIGSYLLAGAFLLAVAYWYREVQELRDPAGPAPQSHAT